MGNEAIDYAKALAAELNHLDERWDAANRTLQTLDREITTVRDKMLEVVKSLGGTLVTGNQVFTLEGNRLVTLQAVVAGQQQGQGHYDPATQSTVRWHRYGQLQPRHKQMVLLLRPTSGSDKVLLVHNDKGAWVQDAWRESALGTDLWAELPQPPRGG